VCCWFWRGSGLVLIRTATPDPKATANWHATFIAPQRAGVKTTKKEARQGDRDERGRGQSEGRPRTAFAALRLRAIICIDMAEIRHVAPSIINRLDKQYTAGL
jgi:hypothetical protein